MITQSIYTLMKKLDSTVTFASRLRTNDQRTSNKHKYMFLLYFKKNRKNTIYPRALNPKRKIASDAAQSFM